MINRDPHQVQMALADELRSVGQFSDVLMITNMASDFRADLRLSANIRKLEWEIPRYNQLQAQAFMVGLFTGLVGGSIYLSTGIDVLGHSDLDVRIERTDGHLNLFNAEYSDSVTNRLKKAVCDNPKAKAEMIRLSFEKSMGRLKADLQAKPFLQTASTNATQTAELK